MIAVKTERAGMTRPDLKARSQRVRRWAMLRLAMRGAAGEMREPWGSMKCVFTIRGYERVKPVLGQRGRAYRVSVSKS